MNEENNKTEERKGLVFTIHTQVKHAVEQQCPHTAGVDGSQYIIKFEAIVVSALINISLFVFNVRPSPAKLNLSVFASKHKLE